MSNTFSFSCCLLFFVDKCSDLLTVDCIVFNLFFSMLEIY